jgi:mRNA interferase HicA
VKRTKLVRYLQGHGCELIREGSKHSVFRNPANGQTAPVPRHREIDATLVRAICKELGVAYPEQR